MEMKTAIVEVTPKLAQEWLDTTVKPKKSLEDVAAAVRTDSQDEPRLYLAETVVPYGGE